MWWLFCPTGRFKPIKLITCKIRGEKLKLFYFLPQCFPVIDMIGSSRPISEKKLPRKKLSRLSSPSGEMPLMLNTNSKIPPSKDPHLCRYSTSTLTFSAPAFCLSSFMILVGGRFPFPKNTDIFYVMVAKGVIGESPPENCPQQTAPGRFKLPGGVGLGLGSGNSLGAIFQGAILLVPAKGKPHFKAKFSPSKNRTVTWWNAYPSKRACWFQFVILIL